MYIQKHWFFFSLAGLHPDVLGIFRGSYKIVKNKGKVEVFFVEIEHCMTDFFLFFVLGVGKYASDMNGKKLLI